MFVGVAGILASDCWAEAWWVRIGIVSSGKKRLRRDSHDSLEGRLLEDRYCSGAVLGGKKDGYLRFHCQPFNRRTLKPLVTHSLPFLGVGCWIDEWDDIPSLWLLLEGDWPASRETVICTIDCDIRQP